ncbi:MAG: CDP-diacylglycerol--glycerol-3-phosphate 3-phosphatidyltransferase [Oscillospiraceae bacterium]|nr:CDP-diacylglycerol--glycerol-3-phosphate 3-phosphatidyltransferase [Oscillospiraceae bacterium]MDD6502554.1 CDP-diacylglycerol--glycerol-3-phosphate 3-phosphatidyltransferase [Oscillospiraceae bacterium]MDY4104699.1 CDP-diacylglycerol--glycerol-3-phosphate 3-phosphatidyltransferase [Oscillospiraceae bacterium]
MTTANKITIFRVICIPVFIVLMYMDGAAARYGALAVFVIASLSDFLDGYIARHYNQVSNFGKFMDPLADKILVITAMLLFVESGRMPGWVLALVVAREFAVSGLRLVAVEQGRVIAAAKSGKIKTASTMVCIILMLLIGVPYSAPDYLGMVCNAVILLTTLYSGIEYFIVNRDVLKNETV